MSEAVHNRGPNFKFTSDKVNHVQAWTCSLRSDGQPPGASDYSSVTDVKVMRLDTANGHLAEIRLAKASASQQWDIPENTSYIKPLWLAQNQTNSSMIGDLICPYSHFQFYLAYKTLTRDWHVSIKIRVQKGRTGKQEWEEKNKCYKQGEIFSEVGSLTTHTWSEELVVYLGYKLAKPVMPQKQKNDTRRSALTCHIMPLGLIFTRSASSGQILVCTYRLNSCLHAAVCH